MIVCSRRQLLRLKFKNRECWLHVSILCKHPPVAFPVPFLLCRVLSKEERQVALMACVKMDGKQVGYPVLACRASLWFVICFKLREVTVDKWHHALFHLFPRSEQARTSSSAWRELFSKHGLTFGCYRQRCHLSLSVQWIGASIFSALALPIQ